jgi:serine/threonine-protein kinase
MGQADLIGQLLDDRYRVVEKIGEGAMGSVYRGERIKLGRAVAIKILHDIAPDEQTRRRFEREALAMAKLEHPHCGAVIDVGVHEGYPYVVMEFVSGQNLKDLLEAGPVPIPRAVEITRQVLSGLAHAHEHGLIHRDIKPANIVLSQKSGVGDHAKILDFGIARSIHDTTNLTGALLIGTPNYMAPEQIKGGDIDHRVDLYACGVMLFELLTGVKPFDAKDPMAMCMQHLNTPPPRLADKAPGRDFGGLEAVVARALEKDPANRFASAEELSWALTATSLPAMFDAAVGDVERAVASSTRRFLAICGALVVVAAAVVGVVVATSRSDASAEDPAPPSTPAPAPVAAAKPSPQAPLAPRPVEVEAAPAPVAPPAPVADPVADLVTQAAQLAAGGRREAALTMLQRARGKYPKEARLPYEMAKLDLDVLYVADGLKNARAAFALDASYKADAGLIKLVLKCFNATASTDWTLAAFLHDEIGEPARPFLEETAASHPNPIVRARAAAELRRYKAS